MIWSKIKKAINSTLGTSGFKPLDKIITDSFGEVVGKQNAMKTALESGENNFIVELAKSSANIAFGTYVGTGTYGEKNPTSIETSFPAKVLIIANGNHIIMSTQSSFGVSFSTGSNAYSGTNMITWSENNISWYCNWYTGGYYGGSTFQLNDIQTYHYVYIG